MNVKHLFLATAIVCALAGCKQEEAAPAEAAAPTEAMPAETAAPADAMPAEAAPVETAATGDSVGVPECDDYITKYMACVNDKMPEASRAAMMQDFDQARASWKQAAATPEGQAGLAQACKTAHEAAKTSMQAFGCEM
jgi:hypothetical protein